MESNNSRTKARLIVLSVFVIGFAAGMLALNLYQNLMNGPSSRGMRGGAEFLSKLDEKVKLSTDQQEQIKKIIDETGDKYREIRKEVEPLYLPKYDAVRQESRDRIRALLTAEQLPKYEEMVQERDKMREQEREKMREQERERSKK